MHDKLFKRARTMYQIEHCICDLLMTKGFLRIETPTLEHFEVFSDVVDNGNYNFFDKNGDLISLRPDITSQIGRVIASTQVHTPIKFPTLERSLTTTKRCVACPMSIRRLVWKSLVFQFIRHWKKL